MKLGEPTPAALNEGPTHSPIASAARALPAGARLDEFEVEEIIGEGSVAIVYAATDRARGVPVAIAEYMPARLAQRDDEARVTPQTSAEADAFANGLKAFINETRMLARCSHPSLVHIVRLCERNSTAYRVMPRYPGRRLLEARQGMNEPPDEEALRTLLDALLGALLAFHQAGGCHGKITPSNILLLPDNRPLLLGPGAAGRAIAGDRIDALINSLEPCFEPIEQIVEPDLSLHPSADLYALAGVARYWMSGQLPASAFGLSSVARREKLADMVQRLRLTWPRLHYSSSLLDGLDSALSIYPAERPQSVAQMRARLGTAPSIADASVSAARTAAPVPNEALPSSPAPASLAAPPAPVAQSLNAVMALAPDPDPLLRSGVARIVDVPSVGTALAHRVSKPRRIAIWSGAVLVLLALLLIAMLESQQQSQVDAMLDLLGIGRGTRAGDGATTSASAVAPAVPVTPPTAADTGATAAAVTPPIAADAVAPAAPVTRPITADDGAPNSMPTEPTAADSPASASALASAARSNTATLAAAATAPPPIVAQPPTRTPFPTSVAQGSRASASPREVCGARTQFSLYRCMQKQCSQPRWASHAQCERLRTTDSVD